MIPVTAFFDRSDIESSGRRIDELFSCGIFEPSRTREVLFRAAFIELLIALRDLMYKTEKYGSRIAFTDDVLVTETVRDVSDLIKYVRDALCHPDSDNHYVEKGNIKASFNVAFGKGLLMKTPEWEQVSPYPDDICFFFGRQRILMNRHIRRAYRESMAQLVPMLHAS